MREEWKGFLKGNEDTHEIQMFLNIRRKFIASLKILLTKVKITETGMEMKPVTQCPHGPPSTSRVLHGINQALKIPMIPSPSRDLHGIR